ncbi:hypothetical protein ACFQZ4_48100 [Catellatospora coxensis]|uniref:Uncharacterized protein n=1 Tax=Catellatospora coxensis TaxID=310354 RepID=A0A8J3KMP2_9ACTN|nr:hypothetical protein [Catellatospora coxensis]GIG03860.1 hypothetical protein Cco03nite_05600 [Catellatospora coxensis]
MSGNTSATAPGRLRARPRLFWALLAVCVVLVAGTVAVTALRSGQRPETAPRTLAELAETVVHEGAPGQWQQRRADGDAVLSYLLSVRPGGGESNVSVDRFDSPLWARYDYSTIFPIGGDGDPVTYRIDPESALAADEGEIVCVEWPDDDPVWPQSCGSWRYIARYGQYIVRVRLDRSGLSKESFVRIAQGVDSRLNAAL